MPSNPDLIIAITEQAEAKGVDVPATDGKNNVELTAILKELKKPVAPKAPGTEADAKAKAEADAKAKAEADAAAESAKIKVEVKKLPPYYMANGKALTTKKGILADGDEIKPEYLAGGKDAIEKFVKTGHILKG